VSAFHAYIALLIELFHARAAGLDEDAILDRMDAAWRELPADDVNLINGICVDLAVRRPTKETP
jgi:hypothetical protein